MIKKGDKVKFVKGGTHKLEHEEWTKTAGLILGNIYTVSVDDPKDGFFKLEGYNLWHHPSHFEALVN